MAKKSVSSKKIAGFRSPLFASAKPTVTVDWRAEYAKIVQLFQQSHLQQALKEALKLYQQCPHIKEVQNLTATLLAMAHREQEAIEIWEKIADKQSDAMILNNIANARLELNYLDDTTKSYFLQALKINPHHQDALFNLGVFYSRIEQHSLAIDTWLKMDSYQQNADVLTYMATARMELHYLDQQTEQLFLDAIALNPNLQVAWSDLVTFYSRIFNPDKAQSCLKHLKAFPQVNLKDAIKIVMIQYDGYPHHLAEIFKDSLRVADMLKRETDIHLSEKVQAKDKNKVLNVGFISADLMNHPVGYFVKPLLETSLSDFRWFGYANTDLADEMTENLKTKCVAWHHGVNIGLISN